MARVGGRSTWIAVPAGTACAAVVATLVYLSLPMVPVTGAWVAMMAQTAFTNLTTPVSASSGEPAPAADAADCRDLYPDGLWAELTWKADVRLAQSTAPPATSVTTLVEALAPTVRLTCVWTYSGAGSIATTLATVSPEAAALAEAALRGQGFACAADDGGLRCSRITGDVLEEHEVRGELWLSSVETGWQPDDYSSRLASNLWG
jgi:hypothetical protein